MTKIEEVARALHNADMLADEGYLRGLLFDEADASVKELRRKQARAAIDAMREPNKAMVVAGVDAEIPGGQWGTPGFRESSVDELDVPVIWRAMIDAALAEADRSA